MHPSRLAIVAAIGAALFSLPACSCGSDSPTESDDGGVAVSATANLKFKGPKRLAADLAQTLELDPGRVCNEIGRFPCDVVHAVALGGSEPYRLGLYAPLEQATATTPMAVERLVLSACVERVDDDLDGSGDAVLFAGLDIDADGRLADLDAETVTEALASLHQRALLREPTPAELDALRGLYSDIEASSEQPARDWAVLACFAVLSSVEQLFY